MQQKRDIPDEIQEIERLKSRLAEAEETLRALQSGEVDALVVKEPGGHKIFTLKGEDYTYRILRTEQFYLQIKVLRRWCNVHLKL
jgi:5,10-methylenetetrahydrofolate reductase